MPIFKGDNWQHLYKGDGHPAALYKGSKKLAGWTEESQAGVSHAYFDDTYNDKADVVIHGRSSQVVTTGAQLFDASVLTSKTSGGVTVTVKDDGTIQIDGDGALQEGGFYLEHIYTIEEIENMNLREGYLFGESNVNVEEVEPKFFFGIYNGGTPVNHLLLGSRTSESKATSISGDTIEKLFSGQYALHAIITASIGSEIKSGIIRPMIYQNGDGTWEPYTGGAPSPSPDYPQEITSVGDSGSVEVVSTGENLYTGGDLYNVTGVESKTFLALGTRMRLDAICDNVSGSINVYMTARYYDKDNNLLGSNGRAKIIEGENIPFDFVMNGINAAAGGGNVDMSNVRKVRLIIRNYTVYDGVFNVRNIMIQPLIPDKPLNNFSGYEQQPSTATFSTPNGLPGIPVDSGGNYTDEEGQQWICDEIDTKKGVYRQNVKKITYTGDNDEYWTRYNVTQYAGFFTDAADKKIASFSPGFSNRFPIDLNITNKRPGIWLGSTDSTNPSTRITFHNCNPSIASSLEEWRTWLSTHPVTLIYPLETPVETPLSDAVDTFLGGTNLFISEHEMDVTVKTEDQANPTGA